MRSSTFTIPLSTMLAVLAITLISLSAAAQQESVVYSFSGASEYPASGVTIDSAGNLYGVSTNGAVWQVAPGANDAWSESLLYTFAVRNTDPAGDVVLDAAGNVYGVTLFGGTNRNGSIYELSPQADGSWTGTILHSFSNSTTDGAIPIGPLVLDAAGNLYGVTRDGGTSGVGVVFELSPQTGGGWSKRILYSFDSTSNPNGGLVFDAAGNLYGTTVNGGPYYCAFDLSNCGSVYELVKHSDGTWTQKVLHNFGKGGDGKIPFSGLTMANGKLYGTTGFGGAYNAGTVFELSLQSGVWTETTLYMFANGADGFNARGKVVFDRAGNLYGVTYEGGGNYCVRFRATCGTVFELLPQANGTWTEKQLHVFSDTSDAQNPLGIAFDASGNIFGTGIGGGVYGKGAVFEITF